MKRILFTVPSVLVLIFSVILPAISISKVQAASQITPNYIVSQGAPAYTNSGCSAAGGNDNDYSTYWSSCSTPSSSNPQFLAYDLSSVPVSERGQVIVAWFNAANYNYDTAFFNDPTYNLAENYTIDANAAPGGSLPTSGWTTLVTTTGNTYHSRQYAVNLTGYNWIRINVTASLGSSQNYEVRFNSFDVYNAAAGVSDDWIFYGDSITANIMDPNGNPTWAQEINQADPSYYPLEEAGGIGGLKSTDGAANIQKWLSIFPGHYVGLSYGTNDAGANSPQGFYDYYVTMINAVLNAGKVPIIPTIPWGCTANLTANVPALNQEIQQLYTNFPQVVKGPDLYGYFSQPQNQVDISSNDCIHPDGAGDTAYQQLWANAMLSEVYQNGLTPPTAALTVTPNSGTAPLAITANASTSTAGTNPIASYTFNFGDGSAVVGPQGGATATHTYTGAGTYTVAVTVTDSANLTSTQTSTVTVTNPSGGGGGSPQTPAFVQSNATTSSKTLSFTKAVSAGDLLVAGITTNDGGTDPISSVSDNLNGAWTKLTSEQYGNGHVELYYLANSLAGNVTVTFSGSGAFTIAEYSGVATTSPVDQFATKASAGGTTSAGPTAKITAANELVIGTSGQTYVGSGFTAGTGFILRKSANASWQYANGLEDMLSASTAGQSMTMASGGSGYYGAIVAVFKANGSAVVTPPTAALAVTPNSGTAPLAITANASASVAGTNPIASYTFNFGDGSAAVGPQTTATATHTYTTAGTYTVAVTVTDSANLTSTQTATVTVTNPTQTPPTPALTVTPSSGTTPLNVTANASASIAGTNPIASYSFTFGDGSAAVGPQATATATHTYTTAGTYTVTAIVTDTANLSTAATATVTVTQVPPTAALTVTPNSGTAPLAITANASTSTAGSNPIASYSFNFGDGSAVVGPQATATATHTYTTAGTYTVTVTVTDSANLTSTQTSTVTVTKPTPPTAALTVTPNSGKAPLAVTANASASTAGTNPIASYTFNFGDGSAVVGPQSAATATHTYTSVGTYTVTVTVTDSANLPATKTSTVTVTNPNGSQTPAFVQSNATTSSKTLSFTKAVSAGDLLVAGITTNDGGTDPISSVSDNLNGAWIKLASVAYGNGHVELYYLANSKAGNVTVTVNAAEAVTIAEYSGVATTSPVDQSATKAGVVSGSSTTAGPTTSTAAANELVIGISGQTNVGSGYTAGTGFTLRASATFNWDYVNGLEDALSSSTVGQSMTMKTGAGGYYGAIVAVFK